MQLVRRLERASRIQRTLGKYHLMLAYRNMRTRVRNIVRGIPSHPSVIQSRRVPVKTIRRLIRQRNMAVDDVGAVWWFYGIALERGDNDALTNHELGFIKDNVPKDAAILVTGCGTGIMLFHLIDVGYKRVDGFDFLQGCVDIANDVAKLGGYHAKIWQDDGFRPRLNDNYDVILAVHWLYSAWHGNYGNVVAPFEESMKPAKREELLTNFLSKYVPHLNPGGVIIAELTDAVADYRLKADSTYLELDKIYPVRFTPEQVKVCAQRNGLEVEDYKMSVLGPQPRTCYRLRKVH